MYLILVYTKIKKVATEGSASLKLEKEGGQD